MKSRIVRLTGHEARNINSYIAFVWMPGGNILGELGDDRRVVLKGAIMK
jgi:hypothetical protein